MTKEIKGHINICGENVVDMVETRPGRDGTKRFAAHLGGSAFNAAMAVARLVRTQKLPIGVRYIGVVSNDQFGEQFMQTMRDAGIDTTLSLLAKSFTTKAFVTSSTQGGERKNGFSFNCDSTAVAHKSLPRMIESLKQTGHSQNIFAFGCISSVMDPEHPSYFEAAQIVHSRQYPVFYDLNTRPQLIADMDQYRARINGWRQLAGIVKMSADDLAIANPGKTLADIANDDSQRIYIETDGGKGASAIFNRQCDPIALHASAKPLRAPNTVGAGDNFNAGFLVEMAKSGLWTPDQWYNMPKSALAKCVRAGNLAAEQHLIRQGAAIIPRDVKTRTSR